MVKPPKIRHSKPRRDPVTIDLDPADVKRESASKEPPATASAKSTASAAEPESANAGSQPAAGTSPSKAETPESTAAKPAEGSDKAAASKPVATGSSPATAGSKDDKATSPGTDTSSTASASAGGKDDRMTTSKSATIGSTSTKDDKAPPPKPAMTGSTSAATGAKDDRKPSGPSVPETKPAPEAKPATTTAGAAKAGAATSVPPSGKPDPGKTAAPGASSPASSKPAGDPKEPPTFGRAATSGPQKIERKEDPAPAPAKRDASRRGGVSAIAAGIVGAAIALLGAGALQYAGVLPAVQTGGTDGSEVAELRTQIDTLREEIAAAGTDGATADTARVEELASGLEQVRSQIAELQAAPPEGGGANTEALQTRLSELESTVASLQDGQPAASPEDLVTLRERVAALEGQVAGVSNAATAAQGAISGIEERLASLETRVQELSGQVEEQASDNGAALAIAAAGLKAAIDRGDPFMTELETFAAVAPDAPEVAALRDLAASGVPTRTAIAAQFDDVAERMIAAANPAPENAGYFDRLLDSMGSLVSVRPIGEVEGEGVGPTLARMEAAIDAGDYQRAIAEYDTLPEAAKAAGADYIASVRARQSADDLVAKALAGALRA